MSPAAPATPQRALDRRDRFLRVAGTLQHDGEVVHENGIVWRQRYRGAEHHQRIRVTLLNAQVDSQPDQRLRRRNAGAQRVRERSVDAFPMLDDFGNPGRLEGGGGGRDHDAPDRENV